jgi:hypothetical protein
MNQDFGSALSKVGRARKLADELKAEIAAFWDARPCELEIADGQNAGEGSFRVKRMRAVPDSIALITGDAAHNLRSALDHLAWAAVPAQDRGTRTCFPIWGKTAVPGPGEWREQVCRQLKGAPAGLIDAVAKLEPWEMGREWLLWAIHELDRIDKHRLLLPVAVAVTGIGLDGDSYELAVVKKYSGMDESGPLLVEPRQWTPVEEGVVLFGSPADLTATEATFFFDVTLSEPVMLRDKPAVTWLRLLADRAETVITDLACLT